MITPDQQARIAHKYQQLAPHLNEKTRRLWAATEAMSLGYGGISVVARATGLARRTLHTAVQELAHPPLPTAPARQRQPGGGRPALTVHDPQLLTDLQTLVEATTRGDPASPLLWTCKSTPKLTAELQALGHRVSQRTVVTLLADLGYSLQATRKTQEGQGHPDRDAQFRYITARVKQVQAAGQPVISVDAKKKELVGRFANKGREWHPKGQPDAVQVHDFVDPALGKVTPYGVYDVGANQGWVSVGIDHDTAEFAVATIGCWWQEMGQVLYPGAAALLILADGGGSNSSRTRLWKVALQQWADEVGLRIQVCHFPPGTSKWNKIEHRMFCHISQNWRGRPLTSREVIVQLISQTTTQQGLTIKAALDEQAYPTGTKVSEEQWDALALERDEFHGDWNYRLIPRSQRVV